MLGHGVGERATLVHLLLDAGQNHLELLIVRLLGQRAHGLGQGNSRVQQGGHLAREHGDVARLDPLEHALEVDLAAQPLDATAAGQERPLRLPAAHHLAHLADEDALLAQRLAQRLGTVGLARARGRLSRGVESFPGVDRHRGFS